MKKIEYMKLRLYADPVRVNGYILYDPDERDALVIDPGGETNRILQILSEKQLHLKYIVLTHGHFDHIAAVQPLWLATKAEICMNSMDVHFIDDSEWNALNIVQRDPFPVFSVHKKVKDGDKLFLGKHEVQILATPGHTPGSISISIPGHLFCGDLILKGEIGRWDLLGADVEETKKSIFAKIWVLPEDTILHCGHGEESSVRYEKQNNCIMNKNRKD